MKHRITLLTIDVLFLVVSFFLAAYWFNLSGQFWSFLAFSVIIKVLLFIRLGLYNAILRYAGLPLAVTIIKATAFASVLCFLAFHIASPEKIALGFFVTDFLLTSFCIGLTRFVPRYFSESGRQWGQKRILIYGAGELGEQVARKILRDPGEYRLVGFLDDSSTKIGKKLHNLPIFGPLSKVNSLLKELNISELIISISALTGEEIRNLTHECRKHGIFCRIVPTFSDMLKKDINIKNLDIADLLKRDPKDLDEFQIHRLIKGKIIMISGAGGSIGSELARQCMRYGAKRLILVDHSELNLYSIQEEFSSKYDSVRLKYCLLNILNYEHLESIMAEEKPSIFLHAAAYKHVPIVEENPHEGIINNVQGTMQTAMLAERYNIEKYIFISTDKAVKPTSIMGASKRICELFIQNFNIQSKTEFVAVRFGNVLGSSGSVVPKFISQINEGGPVTVTHPEVTRYFMLITEAIQLVLQAASIGSGGEVFILNMGKPVRIAEMAEEIIFLSGREPHTDIKIEYTGLRAGEKLYEELLHDETEKKTQYKNITIGHATHVNWLKLNQQIEDLLQCAQRLDRFQLLHVIKKIVPEFFHSDLVEPTMANKGLTLETIQVNPVLSPYLRTRTG